MVFQRSEHLLENSINSTWARFNKSFNNCNFFFVKFDFFRFQLDKIRIFGFPLIWMHFSTLVFLFCTARQETFQYKTELSILVNITASKKRGEQPMSIFNTMLADGFTRKNLTRHNGIYNFYYLRGIVVI